MDREYNPFDFDHSERSRRIEKEVEILTNKEGEEREEQRGEEMGAVQGEADANPLPERELTPEELKEAEEERIRTERRIAREKSIFWQFISGNWMVLEGVTGTYRYLLIIAATLFASVLSIFVTFHLSEQLTRRTDSVQLLRERSLEYQKIRFNKTSHSAIVNELERRSIPLYDLHESKIIIE